MAQTAAAAGTTYTAAASKAEVDLTRALDAVQTGFVDAATAASLKATKTIAAAETVERKAVAKADVVLAKDLQAAWGTYASAECGAVIPNACDRGSRESSERPRCLRGIGTVRDPAAGQSVAVVCDERPARSSTWALRLAVHVAAGPS